LGRYEINVLTIAQFISQMFEHMNIETRRRLISFNFTGVNSHNDVPLGKVFFQFLAGKPIKNILILWLRLGLDEAYVINPEPPSNHVAHWRVVEEMR
jgi:hypothetical protein